MERGQTSNLLLAVSKNQPPAETLAEEGMELQRWSGDSPSLSSGLVRGHDSTTAGAEVAAGVGFRTSLSLSCTPSSSTSTPGARPRRSWDTAFLTKSNGGDGCRSGISSSDIGSSSVTGTGTVGSSTGAGTNMFSCSESVSSQPTSAVAAEVATAAVAATATGYNSRTFFSAEEASPRGGERATSMPAVKSASYDRSDDSSGDRGLSCRSSKLGATGIPACSPDTPDSSVLASTRAEGAGGSDDDVTDTDEGVMAKLKDFTEIARRTAAHNEELSRDLAAEKRRVTQTTRKLEQSNVTSMELRESLALAQDTVMRLREHEMAWAARTASEMSLRSEMCALKDDLSRVSGNNAVLQRRCDVLQQENAELGERFAAIAEEKRQVESKARRLLRSDRYRGY